MRKRNLLAPLNNARILFDPMCLCQPAVNQRLAAVRRLAYEAADSGFFSPELVAGIRRVKGVKQLGGRSGNWLTQDQSRLSLEEADGDDLRSVRDLAMISVLVGCGLRRAELSALTVEDLQIRQGDWAIVDLVGKGGHVRTVPVPAWGKQAIDRWRDLAKVAAGGIFRAVSRHGTLGVTGFPKKSSGTSFDVALRECSWTISLHTIFAAMPYPGSCRIETSGPRNIG